MLRKLFGFLKNPGARNRGRIVLAYLRLKVLGHFRKGPGTVSLHGYSVHYPNYRTFIFLYEEIFLGQHYAANLPKSPRIIDGGANIGLTTLFWKIIYPDAIIECFEPNPDTFEFLKKNVDGNQLAAVSLHQVALAAESGNIELFGDDIGASVQQHHKGSLYTVPGERLSVYLADHPVDLLKLDIEGAEGPVLQAASEHLRSTSQLIMEYHGYRDATRLSAILKILEGQEFSYFIHHWTEDPSDAADHFCLVRATRR